MAAAGGGEAVRHRSRIGQAPQRRTAQADGRASDLPDRSLSRQGDGAEHPGAALRQRHVRADLESQPHRPHPDHRRREARRRPPRQLLRPDRRAARHGAEPSVPAVVAGDDGAAVALRCAGGAFGKGRGAVLDPAADPGRGGAEFGARPIPRRQGRRHRDRGLPQDRGRQARQHHGNLCRAESSPSTTGAGPAFPSICAPARRSASSAPRSRSSSSRRRSRCSATRRSTSCRRIIW